MLFRAHIRICQEKIVRVPNPPSLTVKEGGAATSFDARLLAGSRRKLPKCDTSLLKHLRKTSRSALQGLPPSPYSTSHCSTHIARFPRFPPLGLVRCRRLPPPSSFPARPHATAGIPQPLTGGEIRPRPILVIGQAAQLPRPASVPIHTSRPLRPLGLRQNSGGNAQVTYHLAACWGSLTACHFRLQPDPTLSGSSPRRGADAQERDDNWPVRLFAQDRWSLEETVMQLCGWA
jgi:hypothetical protein